MSQGHGDRKNVPASSPAKKDLQERIEAFLEANAPNEFQIKIIAQHMKGAQYEAVKKCIQRSLTDPKSMIVKTHPGWYRFARSPEMMSKISTAKRVGIHGIEIAGKCPSDPARSRLLRNSTFKIKATGRYSFEFLGRAVTITVYPISPTVLVQLQATANPLSFEEFNSFCFWLWGWGAQGQVEEGSWYIKQFGWNIDFLNLDMTKSGFKRLTLRTFRNDWYQIYQKQQDMVRVEAHLNPSDMSLTDLQRLIQMMVSTTAEPSYQPVPADQGGIAYR